MSDNAKITNADELEFAVFCIENIAIRLGKNAEEIYQILTEKSDILNSYIIPEYEILPCLISEGVSDLHCMSDEYLTEELISEYREK